MGTRVWRHFVQCTIVLGNWGFQINWWIELLVSAQLVSIGLWISIAMGVFFTKSIFVRDRITSLSWWKLVLVFPQWLSIPFAMTNEHVTSITTNSSTVWIKELEPKYVGYYMDSFMLLILGGIPWQAYFQRVLSANSAFNAKMLSVTAGLGCVIMSVPSVLIGAVAANTGGWGYGGIFYTWGLHHPLWMKYLSK